KPINEESRRDRSRIALTRRHACKALTRKSRPSGDGARASALNGTAWIEFEAGLGIKGLADRPDALFGEVRFLGRQSEEGLLQRSVLSALPAQLIARADGHEPALMNDADAVGHFLSHAQLV